MLELRQIAERIDVFGVALQGRKNMCPLAKNDSELAQGSPDELSRVCSERKGRVIKGDETACKYYAATISEDLQPVMRYSRDELPTAETNRPGFFERTATPTTERALAWLAQQPGEHPVFLWVHYQDPHGPYTPPAPFDAAFPELVDPAEAPLPALADDSGRGGIPAYQRFAEERRPASR